MRTPTDLHREARIFALAMVSLVGLCSAGCLGGPQPDPPQSPIPSVAGPPFAFFDSDSEAFQGGRGDRHDAGGVPQADASVSDARLYADASADTGTTGTTDGGDDSDASTDDTSTGDAAVETHSDGAVDASPIGSD